MREESTERLLCAGEFYHKNQKHSTLRVLPGALSCCAGKIQFNAREAPESTKIRESEGQPNLPLHQA